MITIDGSVLVIDTMTLTARMEHGYITSLVSKKTGMKMLDRKSTRLNSSH